MTYPVISANKIQYDKDGSLVGKNSAGAGSYSGGIVTWLTDAQKISLNDGLDSGIIGLNCLWVFFPKLRTVTHFHLSMIPDYWGGGFANLQGSADTTNGQDGTWETATLGGSYYEQSTAVQTDYYRTKVGTVTFSQPVKAIRLYCTGGNSNTDDMLISILHLYGNDVVEDELTITDVAGNKITSLKDFGDVGRNTVSNATVYIKNNGATACTNILLDIEGTAHTFSLDGVTFNTTQKTIASLGVGEVSAPIYIRYSPVDATPLGACSGRLLASGTFS